MGKPQYAYLYKDSTFFSAYSTWGAYGQEEKTGG
jgi:hypothetical protein